MYQLNIFEEIKKQETLTLKNKIKSELKDFNIDKIYLDNFKGQCSLLRDIKEKLEEQKNYKEYYKKLIAILLKYFPLLDDCFEREKIGIWKSNEDWYRYIAKRESGPLYCLEMIPETFFEAGD